MWNNYGNATAFRYVWQRDFDVFKKSDRVESSVAEAETVAALEDDHMFWTLFDSLTRLKPFHSQTSRGQVAHDRFEQNASRSCRRPVSVGIRRPNWRWMSHLPEIL
jgi:hypothetical protein